MAAEYQQEGLTAFKKSLCQGGRLADSSGKLASYIPPSPAEASSLQKKLRESCSLQLSQVPSAGCSPHQIIQQDACKNFSKLTVR